MRNVIAAVMASTLALSAYSQAAEVVTSVNWLPGDEGGQRPRAPVAPGTGGGTARWRRGHGGGAYASTLRRPGARETAAGVRLL